MIEDFIKHHPNTAITRSPLGNKDYASTFSGASNVLLYQLRNLMSFRDLGQLKMTRVFTDGTVITAWSFKNHGTGVYQDFVRTDVRNSIGGAREACTITYINLPTTVAPMRYPQEIQAGEIEGTDYIKTYYIANISGCPTCETEPTVSFTFQFVDATIEHKESPHDAREHCIFSSDGGCFAEIIDQGSDGGGDYIRWKAYTEGFNQDRTGYGFVKLTAIIPSANTSIVCSFDQVIKVDCCVKNVNNRKVEIWWEDFGTCQPFIVYPGVVYNAICKMPTEVPIGGMTGLVWYGCTHPQQPLYAIPEIKGSCLPVEWTLSGPIQLLGSKNDNIIFFSCLEGGCNEPVFIKLQDRCGTLYQVRGTPCCEDATPFSIKYTSLQMGCGGQQELMANGGCGPYNNWSLTGVGSLVDHKDGTATYTAPATNPNCNNPTITVTDCCGSSANITLCISCIVYGVALRLDEAIVRCCYRLVDPNCGGTVYDAMTCYRTRMWDCSGILTDDTGWFGSCSGGCPPPPPCTNLCECYDAGQECYNEWNPGDWNVLKDTRSTDMIEAGCCPTNPLTGLCY